MECINSSSPEMPLSKPLLDKADTMVACTSNLLYKLMLFA